MVVSMLDKLVQTLTPLSQQYGTGDPQGDLLTVITFLLFLSGIFLALSFILGRGQQRQARLASIANDGFDRYAGLAGKFEKLEMNLNNTRTEVIREIEFLKERVDGLERRVNKTEGISSEQVKNLTADAKALEAKSQTVALEEDSKKKSNKTELSSEVTAPKTDSQISSTASTYSSGLRKTRSGFFQKIKSIFSGKAFITDEMFEELQAFLVSTDIGVQSANTLVDELRDEVKRGEEVSQEALLQKLQTKVFQTLSVTSDSKGSFNVASRADGPLIVLMVGVNGVGKTTTTAKIASKWKKQGVKILLVAADTFRAAAVEQLKSWASDLELDIEAGNEGAKPSAVVFDAMERAKKDSYDVVLIDTAGRLHTKGNLMQELEGIKNVVQKHQVSAPHEVILVVDGTSGQNALLQAREFNQAVPLTGLVVTKLDGTPKGGIVVAIQEELKVPVRFIGIGEAAEDLKEFHAEEFSKALFDSSDILELSEPSAHGKRRRKRREQGSNLTI